MLQIIIKKKMLRALSDHHAAKILLEKDLNGQKLVEEIDRILLDENQLKEMKKNAKELGIPDAAKRLYNVMKDLVEQR